jgi:hypothetical protein
VFDKRLDGFTTAYDSHVKVKDVVARGKASDRQNLHGVNYVQDKTEQTVKCVS